jgi:hypothetical protein
MPDRRSPFTALLLSTILPGSGQLYNRETKKGWLIIGSCLGLGLLIYKLPGFNRISLALALLLLWISAIADAYKVARTSGQAADFYYRRPYVVAMLLLIGPLALPLLWTKSEFFTRRPVDLEPHSRRWGAAIYCHPLLYELGHQAVSATMINRVGYAVSRLCQSPRPTKLQAPASVPRFSHRLYCSLPTALAKSRTALL